jgi:hypothetical protein
MKITLKFSLIAIIAITFACNRTKHPEYVAKIDSLLVNIDSLELKYSELNIDTLKIKFELVDANTKIIKTMDDIDLNENAEVKKALINYGKIHKSFKWYIKSYKKNTDDLAFNKKQLETLREDISNDLIADDKIEKYFTDEAQAVQNSNNSILFYYRDVKASLSIYEETEIEIGKIIK